MKIRSVFLTILLLALGFALAEMFAGPATATTLHYTVQTYGAGSAYTGVHLADMDHDGVPEVLVGRRDLNTGQGFVEIWKYDPSTQTLSLNDTVGPFPAHVHDIKTGDFDHDGIVDILVATRGPGVYLATGGKGNWTIRLVADTYAWQVLVADFDHDGNLDFFEGTETSGVGYNRVFYGDGHGSFPVNVVLPIVTGQGFSAVDFNRDGWIDLIGGDRRANNLVAFQNLGGRNWSASLGPSGTYPNLNAWDSHAAGDLNKDGFIDCAAIDYTVDSSGSLDAPYNLYVFWGSSSGGTPAWTAQLLEALPGFGAPVGIADLDGDGNLDVYLGGASTFPACGSISGMTKAISAPRM